MIALRSIEEIESIRKAGAIVAQALETVRKQARAGVTTAQLDAIASGVILSAGGIPAFKGYKGYPANICASVNEEVVHGIPSHRKLKDGDILSVDVGVKLGDYFADAALTVGIGRISGEAERLMRATHDSLQRGIELARPGNRLSDISSAVQQHVEAQGFSVVKAFVGHGIGTRIHEEPEIPNFGKPGKGPRLEAGMVLAIEPMVNAGTYEVEVLEDGWTAVTKDGKLSAHFEHTIAVTDSGARVLTAL
ncbi:MAG: type I methionyl aminopeptidase [Candidatus Omnitrophica bacterium]|nr:type I methionyl aminopeptidase [Candidatus Omnitrophota bacterium]